MKINSNLITSEYNLITDGSPIKTGRKIDGKDEYVVKVNAGSGPNNTNKQIQFNTSNMIITDYYVIGISNNNETIYAPNSATGNNYFNIFFSNNEINLSTNQDRSRFTCYVYIFYINIT